MQKNFTKKLTGSSVLLALSTVLSFVKLFDLPYGGSVTLCSMLPILLIGYRYGLSLGLFSGFIYSVIQLLLGLNNLSYATSAGAAIAIIFLDYIIAFTVVGLGGIFKKAFKSQTAAITTGMVLVSLLRYLCHIVSGCTVWAGLSIPTEDALIYSVGYNATYMLPELLVSVIGAAYISETVTFGEEGLTRKISEKSGAKHGIFRLLGLLLGAVTVITDIVLVAPHLQNEETGDFFIKGLANVNWGIVSVVSLLGFAACLVLFVLSKKGNKKG